MQVTFNSQIKQNIYKILRNKLSIYIYIYIYIWEFERNWNLFLLCRRSFCSIRNGYVPMEKQFVRVW